MKKIRTVLCLFLAAAMLFAACSQDSDDDSPPELTIDDGDDLMKIGSEYPLNGKYTLTGDITLSNWTPIGSGDAPFTGIFDGGEHKITMTGTVSTVGTVPAGWDGFTMHVAGLFGITRNAEIKNLEAEWNGSPLSFSFSSPDEYLSAGIVAGWAENTDFSRVMVSGGSVFSVTASQVNAVGALAGTASDSDISQCGSSIGVSVTSQTFLDDAYVGGLVGHIEIVEQQVEIKIRECFASGNVSAINCGVAGGLVGHNQTGISDSYAKGNVSVNHSQAVPGEDISAGGLAGRNEGIIETSYSRGAVSVTITGSIDKVSIGGIAGISTNDDGIPPSQINDCAALNGSLSLLNSGSVTSPRIHRVAPISTADFTNNIANSGMTGSSFSPNANGDDGANVNVPVSQSGFQTTLGWNFTSIWEMGGDNYPVLRWQP